MWTKAKAVSLCALVLAAGSVASSAADVDELKVKREAVFEFAEKPAVTRKGDRVTVTFETKGYCDVTLAIEDSAGKIVRHLASGVLGRNAPVPFRKNARKQVVVWDGKDDQGRYIDDKKGLAVRVSLGLKPRFERTLFWSPKKRVTSKAIIVPRPEGVYVFDGSGVDHLRLFDHKGDYVKTVYPFPAGKIKAVKGLTWKQFPEGGRFPIKKPFYQQTFLTSGESGSPRWTGSMAGYAASAMAVQGKSIALACIRLNRLATDGSTGGLELQGPHTSHNLAKLNDNRQAYDVPKESSSAAASWVAPRSAAFSPDGKWLYLTGYTWQSMTYRAHRMWLNGVYRIPFRGKGKLELFAGSGKRDRDLKPEDAKLLRIPAAVACDAKGRVYVADHENDRIQVLSPDGKVLKSIPVQNPAEVAIHHKTQDIYVFTWQLVNRFAPSKGGRIQGVKPVYTHFGPFENPKVIRTGSLPLVSAYKPYDSYWGGGLQYRAALDSWAETPTIWLVTAAHDRGVSLLQWTSAYPAQNHIASPWEVSGIQMYTIGKNSELKPRRHFGKEAVKKVLRASWPGYRQVQRLYVNPKTGLLYVGEGEVGTLGKSFQSLVQINPTSGKMRIVNLPFGAEDMTFDIDGLIYLRQTDVIVRYAFPLMREVPWDYGEQLNAVGIFGGRFAKAISALVIPSRSPVCFHQGGMHVSPKGNLVVSCAYRINKIQKRAIERWTSNKQVHIASPYKPALYPGREESSTSACAHVWDRHGKLLYRDAIPGMPQVDGVAIDRGDNLYVMATPARIMDGKKHFNLFSSTLIKFRPKKGKIISTSPGCPIPISREASPKGRHQLYRGGHRYWVQGAEWFFGGVGYAGFNPNWAPSCACWHARFAHDYLGRSFAPEPLRFSVAVLDRNGNLILRVGKYGNVDDGVPPVKDGGPPNLRAIGGDEVGLMHPAFLAVHTDRRLFIQDYGNGRIVSVKLGYHATEKVRLKNVPDIARK